MQTKTNAMHTQTRNAPIRVTPFSIDPRTNTSLGTLVLIVSLALAESAVATTISFDGAFAPCGFTDTVAARNPFPGSGVTFSAPGNDGGAILNQCGVFAVTGYSAPNFLAFNAQGFYLNSGVPRAPETLVFSPMVAGVCFRAGSGFAPGATLSAEAFDGANQPLATAATSAMAICQCRAGTFIPELCASLA